MGNTLATEKIDSSVKKEFQLDKKLFDEIHGKSKLLYDRYKTEFLSKSFCQQVSITYSKMLYKLPMKSLRKIHDKLYDESKDQNIADLDLVVTYNPMNEEKFLVDYLRGKIIENFKNKKIDKNVTKNGIKLTMPDIYYIQNRALQVLDQAYKREYGKKQRGGNYELFLGGSTNEEENNNNI